MIATAEAIRLLCGGWVEDAAGAAYDRIPEELDIERHGMRATFRRCATPSNVWAGVRVMRVGSVLQTTVVGLGIGDIVIRRKL